MRRACSRDVSVASDPFGLGRSVARAVPVEPKGLDQLRDGWRHQAVDRLAAGDVIANAGAIERLEQELRGCPATGVAIEATVARVLAAPGNFLLGLGTPARAAASIAAGIVP